MVVIIIIGILSGIAIAAVATVNERNKANAVYSQILVLQGMLDIYAEDVFDHSSYQSADNAGRYNIVTLAVSEDTTASRAFPTLAAFHAAISPWRVSFPNSLIGSEIQVSHSSDSSTLVPISEIKAYQDLPGY
jgi:type II secretory pathway pseudopilin PulG